MKSVKNKYIKNKSVKNKRQIPDDFKMITATINREAVKNNLEYLRKISKSDVMPVLKANAYGHSSIEMANICRDLNVKYIGVATLGEAMKLRNSGDKGRILGWLYDVNSNQVKDAVAQSIDIGIFDQNHIPIISKSLSKNMVANIHLFVDTGINRNGIPYEKAIDAAIEITKNPKFKLVGIMSHFCCADTKKSVTNKQLILFEKLQKDLFEKNIKPEVFHIAASNGILNYDNRFNLVRSGQAFYGMIKNKNLIPVMSLTSKIIQLKYVEKGEGIGYDKTYITKSRKYIAIVPIGYADLMPLTKSVYVNDTKRKILGLESMDQIVIDGNINDKLGDTVQIFGDKKRGFKQNVFELLNKGSRNQYKMISIGERIKNEYV